MNATQFRATFPEFANTTKYTDASVNFQIDLANKRLPADRWDNLLENGIGLFVAHHLAMNAKAARGNVPGAIAAPLTSKSVDKVSASYDTTAATLEGAGHWNSTAYGIQFLQLARMVGAGGIQL